jgi:hypothetical protein
MIKQSRNHPSIVEYVGGSEMGEIQKDWNALAKSSAQQLMRKIAVEESDRLFRVTDPELGSKHGPWVFNILRAPYSYGYFNGNESETMRYSEFGTASPANLEVWHREIPLKSQWPLDSVADPILIYHNASKSAFTDIDWLFKPWISDAFGPLENLRDLVAAGQYYGAEGLRYIYDALRRKGKRIGGITNHTFSEPWPNAAGSYMIDYDGRPLMNYDFLKQALAPISLSLQFESCLYTLATGIQAELFLVSDAPKEAVGLRAKWVARDRQGAVINHGERTASIAPLEVKSLGMITLHPLDKAIQGPILVELRLEDSGGKLLVERVQIFGRAELPCPFAGLLNTASSAYPIRRTALQMTAAPVRIEGDQEVLDLQVKNTGMMTTLFCEPHPLIVYRTDLFIDNNNCFIPSGESRVITIRASINPECGLSLAQTGWTISTWNADDVTVASSAEVLLSVGRWDKMCREFLGYFDVNQVTNGAGTVCTGNRPDSETLPYRLSGTGTVRFEFKCTRAQAGRAARLRIHSADQAESAPTVVQITINGRELEKTLPKGLGIQRADPAHRAFPATVEFDLAGSDLREGENTNTLTVRVVGDGWFSWDALELVRYEFIPIITQQPLSQATFPGSSATFTVAVTDNGNPPLSYQWRKNGVNLSDGDNILGSTTTNLTVSNITAADVANYDVMVSNPNGAATSTTVALAFPAILMIEPSVAGFSSQIAVLARYATNTVNGSGMSGLGFATDTHDNSAYDMWTAGGVYSGDHNPYITFDLGGYYNLQTTRIWQYNEAGWRQFSATTIVVSTSTNSVTFMPISTNSLNEAGGTAFEPAQEIATAATGVRYVKIQILDTWDGAVFWNGGVGPNGADGRYLTGLSETRFVVALAPIITQHPLSQTNYVGGAAVFTVAAKDSGFPTLSYQWRKDGMNLFDGGNISGAIATNLTISKLRVADAGTYDVVVSNLNGSALSTAAVLTVPLTPGANTPLITLQPISMSNYTGGGVTFQVAASDNGFSPLSYQWRKNGVGLLDGGHISGAGTIRLTITNLTAADAGNYDVVVSNPNGTATTTLATLTVTISTLMITPTVAGVSSQLAELGRYATNTVNGSGMSGPGVAADTHDNSAYDMWTACGVYAGDHNPSITFDLGGSYGLQTTRIWQYNEASWPEFSAKVIVISTSPDNVTFRPISTNTLAEAGRTAAEPAQDIATAAINVRYVRIQVLNTWGGAVFWNGGVGPNGTDGRYLTGFSEVRFVVIFAPLITQQPRNQRNYCGSAVTFTVAASSNGHPPLSYQWRKSGVNLSDGGNISGSTTPNVTISKLTAADAGNYEVVVSNPNGTATSTTVELALLRSLTLGVNLNAGVTAIYFPGVVGVHYRVEHRHTLAPSGTWQTLQDIPSLPATPYTVYDPQSATNSQRFYRLVCFP